MPKLTQGQTPANSSSVRGEGHTGRMCRMCTGKTRPKPRSRTHALGVSWWGDCLEVLEGNCLRDLEEVSFAKSQGRFAAERACLCFLRLGD